jgi:hypothetical protein
VPSSVPIDLRWNATDNLSMPSDATPGAVTYSYRLLHAGHASPWSAWDAKNYLELSNLSPRTYTLEVRARDGAGNVSPARSRMLEVASG